MVVTAVTDSQLNPVKKKRISFNTFCLLSSSLGFIFWFEGILSDLYQSKHFFLQFQPLFSHWHWHKFGERSFCYTLGIRVGAGKLFWSRSCIYVLKCFIFTKLAWMVHLGKLMDLSWKLNLCHRFQMLEEVKILVQIKIFGAGPLDGHIYVIKGASYIHLAGLNAESGPFVWKVGEV